MQYKGIKGHLNGISSQLPSSSLTLFIHAHKTKLFLFGIPFAKLSLQFALAYDDCCTTEEKTRRRPFMLLGDFR